MGTALFGAAIIMFACGAGGLILWYIDRGLASSAISLQEASQFRFDADLALELGVGAVVAGIILTIMALRDPK